MFAPVHQRDLGAIEPARVLKLGAIHHDIFVEGALSGEVRIGGTRTIYTAYGDLFTLGCAILTLFVAARMWRQGAFRGDYARRPESTPSEPHYPF